MLTVGKVESAHHLEQSRPRDDVLALHVNELLHRETLVVWQVDEKGLGHDLQVLFNSTHYVRMDFSTHAKREKN